MKRFLLLVPACALAIAFGCGPMRAPLPDRLDPEAQKSIDDAWRQALTPTNRLPRQDLLDVLVGTQAYQLGVDTLTFRAEKRFQGGTVVMEVGYDRTKPHDDHFDVTVLGPNGGTLRTERYTRSEIESTYHAHFVVSANATTTIGTPEQLADQEKRWKRILSVFPKVEERKSEEAAKPQSKD